MLYSKCKRVFIWYDWYGNVKWEVVNGLILPGGGFSTGACVTNWATLSRVLSMSKTLGRDDFSSNFPINPVHGSTSRYCQFQPPQLQLIFRGFVRADKAGNNGP